MTGEWNATMFLKRAGKHSAMLVFSRRMTRPEVSLFIFIY